MNSINASRTSSRIGFHYYPDSLHYRESDLRTWLPELNALGAAWLVLEAPLDRAIPEPFLTQLMAAGIEPILQLRLPYRAAQDMDTIKLLLRSYAEWGARYVILFDRPNTRSAWPANAWAQTDLVERFLDIYLPLADMVLQAGLVPIFPPLEPGGDYWDTAFLRAALQGIQRRSSAHLLDRLVLSAYAWTGNRPINWGAGGPERWPGARPYYTPPGQQDQRGFYIFDWYLTITQAAIGKTLPMVLLETGRQTQDDPDAQDWTLDAELHAQHSLALAQLLSNSPAEALQPASALDPVPSEILAGCFWILAAEQGEEYRKQAWYQPDGSTLPAVDALRQWLAELPAHKRGQKSGPLPASQSHPISHYLLLPLYEWGVSDWHLDVIRPYLLKHHPTVGFSITEAEHANLVTVIGGKHVFPDESLEKLRSAGCTVERIEGDGTSIATQLANL